MRHKLNFYLTNILAEKKILINLKDIYDTDWRNMDYSDEQKECINSITDFFYFTKYEENINELEKIYGIIEDNKDKIKLKFVSDRDDDYKSFFISIIIFKSFLHHTYGCTSSYGKFKNSDKLLNFCVEYYYNYNIFYDLENMEKRKIRSFFYIIFFLLIKSDIIEEKKIKKDSFSAKFWKIDIKNNFTDYKSMHISYTPYSVKKNNKNTYLVGMYPWNVYDMFTKNIYSDVNFNIKKEEYIDLIIKRHLHIDTSHFEWLLNNLEQNKDNLDYLNDSLVSHLDDANWNIKTKENIKNIQRRYSKKIEYSILENFLKTKFNENDKIYLPFLFDFRGRKYYNSLIGPTQNKILRFVYHYGWYDKSDFSNIVKIPRTSFFKEKIWTFCCKNDLEYNDIFLESYFWLLIGIGKFLIKKEEVCIKDEKIIDIGISLYSTYLNEKSLSFNEKFEIYHYTAIMSSLKRNDVNKIRKRVICKDGTASVYQISMILLKTKNQQSLKWVNLYSDHHWYDTYSYIIKKFKEKNKNIDDNIFNRKICKKTLMTIPYSIGKDNAYKEFINCIEDNNIYIADQARLYKQFNSFFKYVKKEFEEEELYMISSEKYVKEKMFNFTDKRSIVLSTETGSTDISYKKMERKTIDLIFEMKVKNRTIKERITKLINIPTNSIDYSQSKVAAGANLRHFYEADLLRITEISLNYSINSIHDAELIDFNSCSKLILIKNRIFKDLIPDFEIWSPYITL